MKFPFPLSDATALLLRLEMENDMVSSPSADLKDRWRELASAYEDMESVNNVFYDFHLMVRVQT